MTTKNQETISNLKGINQKLEIFIEFFSGQVGVTNEEHTDWVIQLSSETKDIWQQQFFNSQNIKTLTHLGRDFYSLTLKQPCSYQTLLNSIFPRWICPIEHQWPVNPNSEKFVERASQGITSKLGTQWDDIQIFSTLPELKKIAAAVKGRLIQLKNPGQNQPVTKNKNLIVIIHAKGVISGTFQHPLQLGSAYRGGLGFLRKESSTETWCTETKTKPSRAGGKIAEVLALLETVNISANDLKYWLELGAAPGGMTEELLNWGAFVTAVDLAELAPALKKNSKLRYLKLNAENISSAEKYNAILSDMNGPATHSARIMSSLIATLKPGSLIIYTLKLASLNLLKETLSQTEQLFAKNSAKFIATRHLFHNRQEVTIIALKL